MALPSRCPFRPAASMSRPAWSPGGLRKVEPQVGQPSGWVRLRWAMSASMAARLAATSPWRRRKVTRVTTERGGSRQVR